ncbi:MAG: hypothetical protein KAT46_02450 [Deltaproteobacteria bacterium]|nr:hypothetical protein [Deltaproteobacteria bacterium]
MEKKKEENHSDITVREKEGQKNLADVLCLNTAREKNELEANKKLEEKIIERAVREAKEFDW